jgi:HD-GYP domain-containing protein (c-di-GMP phosphodiesterase class II)
MQVSDVYSALIAKRSYKDEFSITDTMNILFEEANNKKFDMSVVEMLNKYSKKVVKSTNKLMEEANNTYSKISNERNKLIEFYEKHPELKSIDLYD